MNLIQMICLVEIGGTIVAENKMQEVANILGVALNENFKLVNSDDNLSPESYRLTNEGLLFIRSNGSTVNASSLLTEIIQGKYSIIKNWLPVEGEKYYSVNFGHEDCVMTRQWLGIETDRIRYSRGLVFRTWEEAKNCANNMLARKDNNYGKQSK